MKRITKAIFPVAGLGSRFLPATKASPKEMLPIVGKLFYLKATLSYGRQQPEVGVQFSGYLQQLRA